MKVGVVLPTFQSSPHAAIEVADAAAQAGVDGVFAYDHLWPMGSPERPALAPFSILGHVARRHPGLWVGPLVARIGLVDNEVLASQLAVLQEASEGRVIAAMGTGDFKSAEENLAYGIAFDPPDERRAALRSLVERELAEGIEVWIGGGARSTVAIAEELGCAVNMWGASADKVREQAARSTVTWAGAGVDESSLHATLGDVDEAGATWAVVGWPTPLDVLARASSS